MTNPYDVLGVAKNADADVIRKAYKALAKKFHPDLNKEKGAEAKFKEINAAYDVLGDDEKRKLYDEFGEVSTRPGFNAEQARNFARGRGFPGGGGFGGGFPGGFPGGGDADFGGSMDDILSSLFGDGAFSGGRSQRRGRDQQAQLAIDPMLAITGGETQILLTRPNGSTETLRVRVPAGVKDGGVLRLSGQGLPPPGGGPCGDLHIKLTVPEHPILRRVDDDLEMEVPVTVLEAMQGAAITVPTPTGDVKVNVPAGVSPGQRLRLRGRGIQKAAPGDLYLVLRVAVPAARDPEVLAAAQRLESAYLGNVRAGLTW